MRENRLTRKRVQGDRNALWEWPRHAGFWRVVRNFLLIYTARFVPSLSLKNTMYRWTGMNVEPDAAVGLMAMFDIFFPELINIGENSIVGYNTVVLGHEYLIDEWRTGPVEIGKNVLIGANCTILPGVRIGDGAVVSAQSLVNSDVPPGGFVGGVPARPLRSGRD
jgi:acetyltransferase-like isoleucine patch superfamily enzyme